MTAWKPRLLLGILGLSLLLAAPGAYAQINAETTGLKEAARPVYGDAEPTPVPVIVGNIVNVVLGLLGLLIFAYILWGGIVWMTAGGNGDKVADATKMISHAVVGALIVLSAFAITNFLVTQLSGAATRSSPAPAASTTPP